MKMIRFFVGMAFSILLLQGCGGGGGGTSFSGAPTYSGMTTQARVDTDSVQDLTTAAASGALQAIVSQTAMGVLRPSTPSLESRVVEVSPKIAHWIDQTVGPFAAKTTNISNQICTSGGTAIENTNDAGTSGSITFTNCGIDDGSGGAVVFSGTVSFSYNSGADSMSMVFHVTVTYLGESQSINMSLSCANVSGTPTCEVSSDFIGLDDRTYRVTDIIYASGDEYSGYDVKATVYDPDYGYVVITTTGLKFECSVAGIPSGGSILISGLENTSAEIAFNDCNGFTVMIGTVGYGPYTW